TKAISMLECFITFQTMCHMTAILLRTYFNSIFTVLCVRRPAKGTHYTAANIWQSRCWEEASRGADAWREATMARCHGEAYRPPGDGRLFDPKVLRACSGMARSGKQGAPLWVVNHLWPPP